MTFKNKLPAENSHPRRSVRQLADTLDVSPDEIVKALHNIGEYVPSGRRQTLEEPVIRRVYDHFGRTYLPEPVHHCSQWERRGTDAPRSTRPRNRPSSRQPTPTGPYSTKTKLGAAGLGNPNQDVAEAWISQAWSFYGFSDVEKDAWMDAGLRDGEVQDAITYRDAGLMPTDLGKIVGGWPVSKRLREGEDPRYVKRLLTTVDSTEAA